MVSLVGRWKDSVRKGQVERTLEQDWRWKVWQVWKVQQVQHQQVQQVQQVQQAEQVWFEVQQVEQVWFQVRLEVFFQQLSWLLLVLFVVAPVELFRKLFSSVKRFSSVELQRELFSLVQPLGVPLHCSEGRYLEPHLLHVLW